MMEYLAGMKKTALPITNYPGHGIRPESKRGSHIRKFLLWATVSIVINRGILVIYPSFGRSLSSAIQSIHPPLLDGYPSGTIQIPPVPSRGASGDICAQEAALEPGNHSDVYKQLGSLFGTAEFRQRAVELHSGAIQIPTETYDQMDDVRVDPRWEAFQPFHEYLFKSFPLIHEKLELTTVNTYGLLYTWQGSETSLKPLLLMAHQDVVPVDSDTLDLWTHPPYSGYYDGERIWGRGSADDKCGLMGIMIAIETLLEQNFEPRRSVILSFGFDEEGGGKRGAEEIAKVVRARYGEKGLAMVVDEGGGFVEQYGSTFAVAGMAEMGYLDVRVTVSTPGGHSSIPPAHTSIGMLSSMLVSFETNPYPVHLERGSPVYNTVQCLGAHASDLPETLGHDIMWMGESDLALKRVEEVIFQDPMLWSLSGTTQAIDLVGGGVKSNALPENAWAVVSHRIGTSSSVKEVVKHDTKLLKPLAERFNLSLTAFGSRITPDERRSTYGTLDLSDPWDIARDPAPVTPASGAPYKLLSGTIKAVFAAHRSTLDEKDQIIHVAPGILPGGTDTRSFWDLSDHIFRYNHDNGIDGTFIAGMHNVNENIEVDAFLEQIGFFSTLVLNSDEADI